MHFTHIHTHLWAAVLRQGHKLLFRVSVEKKWQDIQDDNSPTVWPTVGQWQTHTMTSGVSGFLDGIKENMGPKIWVVWFSSSLYIYIYVNKPVYIYIVYIFYYYCKGVLLFFRHKHERQHCKFSSSQTNRWNSGCHMLDSLYVNKKHNMEDLCSTAVSSVSPLTKVWHSSPLLLGLPLSLHVPPCISSSSLFLSTSYPVKVADTVTLQLPAPEIKQTCTRCLWFALPLIHTQLNLELDYRQTHPHMFPFCIPVSSQAHCEDHTHAGCAVFNVFSPSFPITTDVCVRLSAWICSNMQICFSTPRAQVCTRARL